MTLCRLPFLTHYAVPHKHFDPDVEIGRHITLADDEMLKDSAYSGISHLVAATSPFISKERLEDLTDHPVENVRTVARARLAMRNGE